MKGFRFASMNNEQLTIKTASRFDFNEKADKNKGKLHLR